MNRKALLFITGILLYVVSIQAQDKEFLKQTVPVRAGTYTLGQLFEKMNSMDSVNLTYNARDLPFHQKLVINKDNPSLQEILDQIVKETAVEYQLMDKYIILKKKNLKPTYNINGQVLDAETGRPMVGVNVYLKNSLKGTVTNDQGKFNLLVPPGNDTLVYSFLGYGQKEVPVSIFSGETMNMSLIPANTAIQEIHINGQRKFFGNMDYGRDISSIDAVTIEKQSQNNASDLLHARLAGVWATKTSGLPGDHEKIRIRGQSSLFSSMEPLYVVDGVPVPIVNLSSLGISDLNIHDIANITVLKDASATALYGFQGGNGVVLVDTRQGGEKQISFMVRTGIQWFDHFYDLMSTKDFIASVDSSQKKLASFLRWYYPPYSDTLRNTNWQKEIFSPGLVQEYQLSASGTNNRLRYYLSGNYTRQGGILPNSHYDRFTFDTRLSKSYGKKLALSFSYRGSMQNNVNNQDEYKGSRLIFEGINKQSCLKSIPHNLLYNDFGQLRVRINFNYAPLNSPDLPDSIIKYNNLKLNIYSNSGSLFARWQLTPHINIEAMESAMYRRSIYNASIRNYSYSVNAQSFLYFYSQVKSTEDIILFNHQANISYNNKFGRHNIGLVLAYRLYKDNLWWRVDSMNNSLPTHYYLKNSMAGYGPKGSVLRTMGSLIGNFNYNYRETYFLSAVSNLSHIKEGLHTHYYNIFPSIALSWDMANERPLRNIRWLDNFAPYVNWGQSGNFPLNGLSNDLYQNYYYTQDSIISKSPSVLQLANHYLRHESTTELDYGIKTAFLHQRIMINAACYSKNISNLIIQRDIPYYYGGGKQYINIGKIAVKGLEFGINITPLKTNDLYWNMDFNFSTSHQKVTRLLEGNPMTFIDDDIFMPEFVIKEGEPLGNIYGFKNLGRWTAADEAANNRLYLEQGGMKYLNADSTDNVLNNNDKVVLGNSIPRFTWNLINSFRYKNLSIDLIWYAVWGMQKYDATRAATVMTGNNREINQYIEDTLRTIESNVFYESSVFVEDASFIRLKTITFSYEFNHELFGKYNWELSLSLENMITFTHYKGYDPEATIFTDNNFSDNAIDRGTCPNPKGIYVTIHLKF